MKYTKGVIATSHVDRHGDRLTREALASMVEQINKYYIPQYYQHDPRIPPLGRAVHAELKQLDDGEYAVEATTQIFEAGDEIEPDNTGRKMPLRRVDDESLHLVDDRSFATPEDQALIEELRCLVSGKKETEEKKALEPVSILQIAGLFIAGGIASGLLSKVGADCWDAFKRKLSELARKKSQERGECLLTFRCMLKQQTEPMSLEVILTNPSETDIDLFLRQGLQDLDRVTPQLLSVGRNLSKIVLKYSEGKLEVSFGVRRDAVPVYFKLGAKDGENDD
jgi:hypothetical protein